VADSPTSEPKAAVEHTSREREGGDRGRRRGGRGKGKGGRPERDDQRAAESPRPEGERRAEGERRDDRGKHRGKGGGRDDKRRDRDRSDQPLKAGLFAGVADREMPCRVAGCPNTWTWYGTQQIRSLGKPEPKRMCDEHLAEFEGIADKQMPCRNSWCTNTWLWTRAAQLYQREKQDKLKPPHRLCDQCFDEERTTEDMQVPCKIPECKHTWTWPRQAQLRHRAWVHRMQAKIEAEEAAEQRDAAAPAEQPHEAAHAEHEHHEHAHAEHEHEPAEHAHDEHEHQLDAHAEREHHDDEHEHHDDEHEHHDDDEHEHADGEAEQTDGEGKPDKRRRRKRRRKRKIHDGPPEKLCESCFERANLLEPIEVPCKVHGCTNTWTWEREGQLRAWAAHEASENPSELPQPPRRMCNSCFEFVRRHGDREIDCGRPGCDKTWTYKTGAQLQDFLAGRSLDPIRLCEDCSRSQFVISSARGVQMPAGAEVMPCQVAGCTGSWVYAPGMKLSAADPDASEPPLDRMCDDCREQRGAPGRDPRRMGGEDSHDEGVSEPTHATHDDPSPAEPSADD
jgi:hypothetical protein